MYRTIDPSTGNLLREYDSHNDNDVEHVLAAAEKGWGIWRFSAAQQRSDLLERVGKLLLERKEQLARLMAEEMGKPLTQGLAEIEKCAGGCQYFAHSAAEQLAPESRPVASGRAEVRYDPIGPLLAIMPWNFPFWQVFRFAAPTLMAGNVVLLKHSPNTAGCAEAITDLFRVAEAPEGIFQNLRISNEQAANVIADRRVRGVTLTGSGRAGRQVAAAAGAALKPAVLELGGSDPFIVFRDTDLARTAIEGASSRCFNNGQTCISAKRFLVERSVAEPFLEQFVAAMNARRVGHPLEPKVENGPMARADLRDSLQRQVEQSVASGAVLLSGGAAADGNGFFFPPTVLSGVRPGQVAFDEELFGPVAAITFFENEAECVALANHSTFGLAASLWTDNAAVLSRIIPALDVGAVFVNETVKSDPALPFGGVKDSGFGRELGLEGIRQFTNIKTVKWCN